MFHRVVAFGEALLHGGEWPGHAGAARVDPLGGQPGGGARAEALGPPGEAHFLDAGQARQRLDDDLAQGRRHRRPQLLQQMQLQLAAAM